MKINPKRVRMVREARGLDGRKWPDRMTREKLYEFCLLTGFRPKYFRQDDPPELIGIFWCRSHK